jgi:ATP-dependent DNA helicase PIF1
MLITNLEPEAGLVNGSRGVVVGYEAPDEKEMCDTALEVPVVQFRNGDRRKISHASWEVLPGVMRRQIPLKLAYAITIHKSQGATLDCAPSKFCFGYLVPNVAVDEDEGAGRPR